MNNKIKVGYIYCISLLKENKAVPVKKKKKKRTVGNPSERTQYPAGNIYHENVELTIIIFPSTSYIMECLLLNLFEIAVVSQHYIEGISEHSSIVCWLNLRASFSPL